jgi:hypothetical protein
VIQIPVTAECPCGEPVRIDESTVQDSTVLLCPVCGNELGTYGALKDRARAFAEDRLNRLFLKASRASTETNIVHMNIRYREYAQYR